MFNLRADAQSTQKNVPQGNQTHGVSGTSQDNIYGGFKTKVPPKTKGSSVKDGKIKGKLPHTSKQQKKQGASQSLYKHKGSASFTPGPTSYGGILNEAMGQLAGNQGGLSLLNDTVTSQAFDPR